MVEDANPRCKSAAPLASAMNTAEACGLVELNRMLEGGAAARTTAGAAAIMRFVVDIFGNDAFAGPMAICETKQGPNASRGSDTSIGTSAPKRICS